MSRSTSSGRGGIDASEDKLVEVYQHTAVSERYGSSVEAARTSQRQPPSARLGQYSLAVGLVVLRVVRAHLRAVGRVLPAQSLGREDGLTVGLVVPFAVRLVGGHGTRRWRYLKIIKATNRTEKFSITNGKVDSSVRTTYRLQLLVFINNIYSRFVSIKQVTASVMFIVSHRLCWIYNETRIA